MQIATAQQMRDMDRIAIEHRGIPSTLLMERAAEGFAAAALEVCGLSWKDRLDFRKIVGTGNRESKKAAVFCGPGNNGGDGVAAARLLMKQGFEVRAFLVGKREKMTADCLEMERRLVEAGGCLEDLDKAVAEQEAWCKAADVVLDAIFGIGLNTDVRGTAKQVIAWINGSKGPVVSADIASGVEADTGRVLGCAVNADVTVTFTYPKVGHFVGKGALHTGRLVIHDIGIPEDVKTPEHTPEKMDRVLAYLNASEAAHLLPKRQADGHKGTFGKVYVLGGSTGYTGAPVFSTRAAVRSGSGLVFAGVPRQIYGIVAGKSEEAMPYPLSCDEEGRLDMDALWRITDRLEQCDAGLLGPGMGRSEDVERLVCKVLMRTGKPLVVDADGLYAIRNHKETLRERADRGLTTILTPHDGEFSYLGGDLSAQDRMGEARRFAEMYGCILVLKGHRTIVAAPDGRTFVNTTGNSGMAKGGSGDVLAGMILSFLGQGMNAAEAAALAVWIHGRAGDLCAKDLTAYAMRPMDLIEYLPMVFKELEEAAAEDTGK